MTSLLRCLDNHIFNSNNFKTDYWTYLEDLKKMCTCAAKLVKRTRLVPISRPLEQGEISAMNALQAVSDFSKFSLSMMEKYELKGNDRSNFLFPCLNQLLSWTYKSKLLQTEGKPSHFCPRKFDFKTSLSIHGTEQWTAVAFPCLSGDLSKLLLTSFC